MYTLHSEVISCQASIVDLKHESGIIHCSVKDLQSEDIRKKLEN